MKFWPTLQALTYKREAPFRQRGEDVTAWKDLFLNEVQCFKMDTFSDFMNYLEKNGNLMKHDLKLDETSDIYKFYQKLFNSNYIKFTPYDPGKIDVAATDSSEFLRMLYNGKIQ